MKKVLKVEIQCFELSSTKHNMCRLALENDNCMHEHDE